MILRRTIPEYVKLLIGINFSSNYIESEYIFSWIRNVEIYIPLWLKGREITESYKKPSHIYSLFQEDYLII